MNARSLLISIGIVAVVTGGALGSGALTQVNAERTATVETAGDASAAIELEPAGNADSTINASKIGTDGELELKFTNINKNATTTTTAFNVTNTLNSDVGLNVTTQEDWLVAENVDSTTTLGANGGSKTVRLTIYTNKSSFNGGTTTTITVEANTADT